MKSCMKVFVIVMLFKVWPINANKAHLNVNLKARQTGKEKKDKRRKWRNRVTRAHGAWLQSSVSGFVLERETQRQCVFTNT